MQFNRDPYKQANEVTCPRKSDSENFIHPPIKFDNNSNGKCPNQKHLGFVLDSKLIFSPYVDQKIKKVNKLIGLIRRLSVNLPGIDYSDNLYDQIMIIFRIRFSEYGGDVYE